MNPPPSLHPTIVPSGQNPAIHAFGEEVVFHLTGEQTGGAFTQWVETTPPRAGPPPHWHTNEDEWFFVLEGRVSLLTDGVWHEAGLGAAGFMPKNSVHAFKNVGEVPLRMLITTAPLLQDARTRDLSKASPIASRLASRGTVRSKLTTMARH